MKLFLFLPAFLFFTINLAAQSDSAKVSPATHSFSHRDSMYLAKLNTSGNLMIAGGVGLCAVGAYFIYEGIQIYNTPGDPLSANPSADLQHNRNQGTAYAIAGGACIAGGIILGYFGIRNKIDFKQHLKYMSLQTGLLQDGDLGASLTF